MSLFAASPILLPILTLVAWTLLIQGWMAATRLPAMSAAKIDPQKAERTQDLAAMLPKEVQWKADNYNHLMEQPTIFYAATLALGIAGLGTGINLWLAWAYVAIRVVHSLVHTTVNNVNIRFSLFSLSTLALLVMVINGIGSMIL